MFRFKNNFIIFLTFILASALIYILFFNAKKNRFAAKLLWKKNFREIKRSHGKFSKKLHQRSTIAKTQPTPSGAIHLRLESKRGFLIDSRGRTSQIFPLPGNKIWEKSIQGQSLIGYNKIGKIIHLYNTDGKKVWNLTTLSYPKLSPQGLLFLLINGDTSSISLLDIERNVIIEELAFGHILTCWAWSFDGSRVALGFLDGFLVVADAKGNILIKQRLSTPPEKGKQPSDIDRFAVVKSLSLSPDGKNILVHFGLPDNDFLAIFSYPKALNKENRAPGKEKVPPLSLVPLESFVPHETALAISTGGKPVSVIVDGRKLSFYAYSGEKIATDEIFAKYIKKQSKSLEFINFLPGTGFHHLAFSKKGDLAFLAAPLAGVATDTKFYDLHLFIKNGNRVKWQAVFQIKAGKFARSIFFYQGNYLLIEGEENLHYLQLYSEDND